MASVYGGFGVPSQDSAVFDQPNEIVAQGFDPSQFVLDSAIISGSARDAGSSSTIVLRPGLILGKITSSLKYIQWDSTATDGSQNVAGILWKELRMQDFNGSNTDRCFEVIVGRGVMQAAQLWIKGVSLVGAADEYMARRQLVDAGFCLDDDPFGYSAGRGYRIKVVTAATTLAATDNGTLITNLNATAAATATLPAPQRGLRFGFINQGSVPLTISAPSAVLVAYNNAAATSINASNSGQIIGWGGEIIADSLGTSYLVKESLGSSSQGVQIY